MGFLQEQFKKAKAASAKHKAEAPKRQADKLKSIQEETKLLKAKAQYEKQKSQLKKVKAQNSPNMDFLGSAPMSSQKKTKKRKPEQYGSNWDF